jgi:hypothetical protein
VVEQWRGFMKKLQLGQSTKTKILQNGDKSDVSEVSGSETKSEEATLVSESDKTDMLLELDNAIINGFQLATASGISLTSHWLTLSLHKDLSVKSPWLVSASLYKI